MIDWICAQLGHPKQPIEGNRFHPIPPRCVCRKVLKITVKLGESVHLYDHAKGTWFHLDTEPAA